MVNNNIPVATKEALDILLSYEKYSQEELVKALNKLEEYERPRYLEGEGVLAEPIPVDQPDKITHTPTLEQHFHFDKLGIEVIFYTVGDEKSKVTIHKTKNK